MRKRSRYKPRPMLANPVAYVLESVGHGVGQLLGDFLSFDPGIRLINFGIGRHLRQVVRVERLISLSSGLV